MMRREPGPFATFDLDVALALIARMSREFGASVRDVDTEGERMVYVLDVPRWGRAVARGTDLAVRNGRLIRDNQAHIEDCRQAILRNRDGMRQLDASLESFRTDLQAEG
jgi:hypothetical protein